MAISVANAQYAGGSGTADDPYQIATAADLIDLGETPDDYGKHFVLTADIDLDPILPGRKVFEGAVIDSFTGGLDGNGHVISHLTIRGDGDLGLFRRLQNGARISNLGLEAVDVNGTGNYVGGLVAYHSSGSITASYSTGTVTGDEYVGALVGANGDQGSITTSYSAATVRGGRNVGGLVGTNLGSIATCHSAGTVTGTYRLIGGLVGGNNDRGSITMSYSTATVRGARDVGGLVGANFGSITTCRSTGTVSGTTRYVGGLVGTNDGNITATYSTARVSGSVSVGGLVGATGAGEDTSITMSYSTGTVTGDDAVGGLVGENPGSVASGFWDIETSGLADSAGGVGRTTAEMQRASTFLDAGWDFVGEAANGINDLWKSMEGLDYPRLWWERYGGGAGEPNDPYRIYTAEHIDDLRAAPDDWDKHFELMTDIDLSGYSYDEAPIAPDTNELTWWEFDGIPFNGVLDGNGHAISHLKITGQSYLGLFGQLGAGAEISNLRLEVVDVHGVFDRVGGLVGCNRGQVVNCCSAGTITGDRRVGGLVGDNYGDVARCCSSGAVSGHSSVGGLLGDNSWDGGSITECHSTCEVNGRGHRVGGLVGASSGSIATSYSSGTILGDREVGGLVGSNKGDVMDCHTVGVVSGQEFVGGLVGANGDGAYVGNSFSTATVTGYEEVGGLVGANWDADVARCFSMSGVDGIENVGGLVGSNTSHFDSGNVYQCYSGSTVSGYQYVGGLLGSNADLQGQGIANDCYSTGVVRGSDFIGGFVGRSGVERQCFWNTETSGLTNMCGSREGAGPGCDDTGGKTTAAMQTASTFIEAGWDFVGENENGAEDIWWILEGQDYPRLWWELPEDESSQ